MLTRIPEAIGKRVVVRQFKSDSKTEGGIYLPDEKPLSQGEVVGTGIIDPIVDDWLDMGDTVVFAKWGGVEVKLDGVTYIILGQDEIVCKIPEQESNGSSEKD